MTNIKTNIIIIFLISLSLVVTKKVYAEKNFFNEAKAKYDEKKLEESKFLFQRNIVFNPKDANSYLYLAKIFEEEYQNCVEEFLNKKNINDSYLKYIKDIDPLKTHNGYFSIDRKTKRLIDPTIDRNGEAKEVDAYELILKDKEKLLSFEENTRFIFSHSALSEGWDNPNVFDPSRWDNPSDDALKAFMPFSLGRKNCIGQSLAKAEIETVLASLFVDYQFSVDSEGTAEFTFAYHPVGARLFVSKC